jgi:uncharacterized SAM-binding protein YcdF (DUF218 family)
VLRPVCQDLGVLRLRRRIWQLLALLAVSVLVLIAYPVETDRLFRHPHVDQVAASDAVVVLAGGPSRLEKRLELVRRGLAPLLIVSNPSGDWAYMWVGQDVCNGAERKFDVICFRPQPESTRGEARAVGRIARERHLSSLIVVTSTFHVTRARLLVGRCFAGRLSVIDTPYLLPDDVPRLTRLEWLKLAQAELLERGC